MKPEAKFFEAIESIAFNRSHRELLSKRLNANALHVEQSKSFFSNLDLARTRASFIKGKVLDNLDKYLIEFESNFLKKGGKVIWAQDAGEAIVEISKIIERKTRKNVVKNKSLIFEEIALNKELTEKNIPVSETDFGNFIQTQANETCYHPVFPTLHQDFDSIQNHLQKKIPHNVQIGAQQLAGLIGNEISEKLQQADVAICGVNFLIADSGSVVILENEANSAKLCGLGITQIAIAGIQDILPGLNDLDLFLHLFSTHSSGNLCPVYSHLISGPKQNEESEGPDEMVVVLIDNGRSDVLAQINQRSALACIQCAACFNVCPVYKNVGGHAYQTVYNGPIGSILSPLMLGMEEYKYLSFASSSSMECVAECPVKIDFPKLLQHNRTSSIKLSSPAKTEKLAIFFWKTAMLKRNNMDKGGAKLKNFMLRQFFKKSWGERREMPTVAQKSFNQIWRERKGLK